MLQIGHHQRSSQHKPRPRPTGNVGATTPRGLEPLRRDATRVIYDILTLGARGASKTQIIFRANLSHKLVQKYTVFLVKKGLLSIEADLEGSRYFLTEKGGRLFHLLQEVER